MAMLEGMLDDIAVQGAAAELLEPVYAGRGDWTALIRDRRDPPAAGRGPGSSGWRGRSASRVSTRSSSRTTTARCAGTARSSRRRRPSTSRRSSCCASPASWIAGRTSASLFAGYLASELGDEPRGAGDRRAARPRSSTCGSATARRRASTTGACYDARPDDREVAQLFEGALERWESLAGAARADRRAGGARRRARVKKAFLRRSAKLDEERLGQPRPRHAHAARDVDWTSIPACSRRRDLGGAELERLLRDSASGTTWPTHLAVDAGARRPMRAERDDGRAAAGRRAGEQRRRSVGARSIATRRSWSARPGTARRSRRWSAVVEDPDRPLPRGGDPRADLPEGRRLAASWSACSTRSSTPSTTATTA